jgi:manganese-dependent inorganic pyrophosphatase
VDGIIIVDTSDRDSLSPIIQAEKVIEVIDHRKVHEAHSHFPNAKIQIELVGSAATLIAEKFHQEPLVPSHEAAALLYSAIVSNTINFQAQVTTPRDYEMADWLQKYFSLPENYVHDMFADKSYFRKSLKETIVNDFATFNLHNHTIGIAQLEIVDVDAFIEKNKDELQTILEELKKEEGLEYIFLTCIDLEKAFNKLFIIDDSTKIILEEALQVKFENGSSKREGILMRKELVPLIKDYFAKRIEYK